MLHDPRYHPAEADSEKEEKEEESAKMKISRALQKRATVVADFV